MRVLVTGASGFIGQALARALARGGHEVVCAARRPMSFDADGPRCETLAVDFAQAPASAWWRARLVGIDAVVNAVGILREQGAQTFTQLHAAAPARLFEACAQARVRCVVQVSALGADDAARSTYHLSKKSADDALRALGMPSAIVQPSLVYGPGGASAAMFNRLAVMPVLALPGGGKMLVQPVHIDDVVEGIVALLNAPPAGCVTIAFVGPEAMTLRDYLGHLRRALGISGPLRVVAIPAALFLGAARVAGHWPGSVLDTDTAAMLLRGNAAPVGPFTQLLARAPRAVPRFIQDDHAAGLRTEALLGVWTTVLRAALALMWIWTGIVALGLYPVEDSMALLARAGLHGSLATFALYGAALVDLLLGVLTLAAPARWRGTIWATQLALIGGYTLLISVFLPEYWLHPYGPISKNLPVMAAITLLWMLERPSPGARAR